MVSKDFNNIAVPTGSLESGLQNKVIYHVVLEAVQSICGLFMTLCHSVLDECRATVVFI